METTPKGMLVIFAFIIAFAYFVITEINKEAAVTALQGTSGQVRGTREVLAARRNYLQQLQNQRTAAESEQKLLAESVGKMAALSASEEAELAALRDVQSRIHDTHKQYVDAVRATVEGFIGTKTASILLKSGKTLTNLTLSAATEEALTFSHDAGITKVPNIDLSDESRKLFGLPGNNELTQILEEYRSTEQERLGGPTQPEPTSSAVPAATVAAKAVGSTTTTNALSSAEIAGLEEQLAKVRAQHDKLLDAAKTLRPGAPESSLKSREAIADKLGERMVELQTLIENAKGQR